MLDYLKSFNTDVIRYDLERNIKYISIGCELNFLESEKIKALLLSTNCLDNILVINTCGVHNGHIEYCKNICEKAIQTYKNHKIFIVGCGVYYLKDLYVADNIYYISNDDKLNIESYGYKKVKDIPCKSKGLIEIQTGCNSCCAYCIVPRLRGSSKSKSFDEIKKDIQEALSLGLFDINLTGVNITQYSYDNKDLVDLIIYILKEFPQIHSLQMSTVDPAYDRIFELIELIKVEDQLIKELYLGTQSGSDKVLKSMRRNHTENDLLKIIEVCNNIIVRHDFMVGFPGETEEDYLKTKNILRLSQSKFDYGNISKYTEHKGTLSCLNQDKVSEDIITYRYNDLIKYKRDLIDFINVPISVIKPDLKELKIDNFNTFDLRDFNVIDLLNSADKIKKLLDLDKLKQIYLYSNLLGNDIIELKQLLGILLQNKPNYQKIVLYTDYILNDDVNYKIWNENLEDIKMCFNNIELYIQVKVNEDFVNHILVKPFKLFDSTISLKSDPYKIPNRKDFLLFLSKFVSMFGINKILEKDIDSFWTNYSYIDVPNKDCKTDIKNFIKMMEVK